MIQTYNRRASLDLVLASLSFLAYPDRVDYEIFAVDNDGSDEIAGMAEKYAETPGSRLRSAFEPKARLSNGGDRTIAEARWYHLFHGRRRASRSRMASRSYRGPYFEGE
jgi:glycosyltransferase involved in cell wall biosynthesis